MLEGIVRTTQNSRITNYVHDKEAPFIYGRQNENISHDYEYTRDPRSNQLLYSKVTYRHCSASLRCLFLGLELFLLLLFSAVSLLFALFALLVFGLFQRLIGGPRSRLATQKGHGAGR